MTLWGGVPTQRHNDVILEKIVWRRPLTGDPAESDLRYNLVEWNWLV